MRVIIFLSSIFFLAVSAAFAADVEEFRLETEDGYSLAAFFYPADVEEPAPVVIMVHGARVTHERWDAVNFPADLNARGWHVLSFDNRGRGASDPIREGESEIPGWLDVSAAIAQVQNDPRVDGSRIVLVGESFGANKIITGYRRGLGWDIRSLVALSPTRVVFMWPVTIERQLQNGLYVGAEQDPYPAVASIARVLGAMTAGRSSSVVIDSPAHGVGVLLDPDVREQVIDWIADSFE